MNLINQNGPKAPNSALTSVRHYTPARQAATPFDLEAYLSRQSIPEDAAQYIRAAFARPSRSPSGYASNTIKLPVPAYGYVITPESRRWELPAALTHISRPDVLRLVEQPGRLVVHVNDSTSHPFSLTHIPDLLVLTRDGIEVYEVKAAAELARLCLTSPNRYQSGADGRYRSAPIERFFSAWNFKYYIISEHNLDPNLVKAALFLRQYVNTVPASEFSHEEVQVVIDAVSDRPGITVGELPIDQPPRRVELALHLIANGVVYTPLSNADMEKPQELRLYNNPREELAHSILTGSTFAQPTDLKGLGYQLVEGAELHLKHNGKLRTYIVHSLGKTSVTLRSDDGLIKMSHAAILDAGAKFTAIRGAASTIEARYRAASREDRLVYLHRRQSVSPYLPGGRLAGMPPDDRSVRRWRDAFLENERMGLPGDLALFPLIHERGNRACRMDQDVFNKLIDLIKAENLRPSSSGRRTPTTIRSLLIAARENGEIKGRIPSLATVCHHCNRGRQYTKALIQGGKRMAEPYAPMFPPSSLLGSPHGQRTWMVTHVDTTVMDLSETHANQDHEVKKSHLMKLVDAFSGEELAAHRFEGSPNAMCVRELLLHCFELHQRLPAAIVCDHGKEHKNTWLEKACGLLGIILIYRPVSDPRKGAPVETTFSTLCKQLLHQLAGNTALLKHARLVTKAVDPRGFTLWSREEIDALLEEYLTLRNNLPRQRKPSPVAIARATDLKYGPAPLPNLSAPQVREALMPLVPRFTRKVSKRGTIYCNKHTYHSRELEEFIGENVEVRSEPLANGIAPEVVYAYPKGRRRTIECTLNDISGPSADIVAAADVIDEQTLGPSPYDDVTSAEIMKAKFAAKIVSTEKRMRAKKAERPPPPKAQPPQAIQPNRQFTFTPASNK
jgi:hypothetical protein